MAKYKMIYKGLLTTSKIIEAPSYEKAEKLLREIIKKEDPFKIDKLNENIDVEDHLTTGFFIEENCPHCHQLIKEKSLTGINLTEKQEDSLTDEEWDLYDHLRTLQHDREHEAKNKNKKTKLGKKSDMDTSCDV